MAEALYAQALESLPRHFDAIHMLRVVKCLKTDARQTWHVAKLWSDLTAGRIGFATLGEATRNFLDGGRSTAEALKDTPVKFAPLPVTESLAYRGYGLPAIAVIQKWIELHMLDDEQRRASLLVEAAVAP